MERLDRLIETFKSRSITHPHISLLWVSYLEAKKKNLDTRLTEGEQIADGLSETGDINTSLLVCMLAGIPDL